MRPTKTFFSKLLASYLLIGVLPLVILSPLAYIVTRNILVERTKETTQEFATLGYRQLEAVVDDAVLILETIATDPVFVPLFDGPLTDDERTSLYNSLFLLLMGRQNKPAVYVVDSSLSVRLNSAEIPPEYHLEQYQSWGVLRKAAIADGEVILYLHRANDPYQRVMSIARYVQIPTFSGYIILDLFEAHLAEVLAKIPANMMVNLAILDEHKTMGIPFKGSISGEDVTVVRQQEHLLLTPQTTPSGSRRIYAIEPDHQGAFFVAATHSLQQIDEITSLIATISIGLGTLLTLLGFYLAFIYSRKASEPLKEVVRCLERVGEGDFSARTAVTSNDEFGLLARSVDQMVVDMQRLIEVNNQREQSLRSAQIKALQAQLNPHFMFNCLELIKWYILLGEVENASQTVIELGQLLRSTLDLGGGLITLSEELEIIGHYLALQQRRLGARLSVSIEVDDRLRGLMIPRFLLQPLVENAVMHGLEKKRGKGALRVTAERRGGTVTFVIADNGVGMKSESAQEIIRYRKIIDPMQEGTGVQNVLRRLLLYYGEQCTIDITSEQGEGTRITIVIEEEGLQWKSD
jgi:two-component system sensor histidine kinase YesM